MLTARLRALLADRRVDEVADAMPLARSAVYYWLAGAKLPSAANLGRFLEVLGVTRDDEETWKAYNEAQRSRRRRAA